MANNDLSITKPRIDVSCVQKRFKIYYDKGNSFKEKLLFWKRNRHEIRYVLNGVSLKIKQGETVGLIGRNGCGKSTLLKLISGIYYPNAGKITINGRVSSLLELGAGFHPDMTGRENIYINASIFGLTKKEIDERLNDIINFSELQKFIDVPVRTYSSGMYMRLAFSVAINVDADVLLIDEILAVGDANFQKKCFAKLEDLKNQGVTIVIVTHDIDKITSFCDRAIWIKDGQISYDGDPKIAAQKYLDYMDELDKKRLLDAVDKANLRDMINDDELRVPDHFGDGGAKILSCTLLNASGKKSKVYKSGDKMDIHIRYQVDPSLKGYILGMGFIKMDGVVAYGTNTSLDGYKIQNTKEEGEIIFHIDKLNLMPGNYGVNVSVVDNKFNPLDFYNKYTVIKVEKRDNSVGEMILDHRWEEIDNGQ